MDTGSLRGDLLSLLTPWARAASSRPYGRVIAALLSEAQNDPAYAAQYRQRVVQPRRDRPARSSPGPWSGARSRPRPRRRWQSTSSTARCTTACCTDMPLLDDRFVADVVDMALAGIYA